MKELAIVYHPDYLLHETRYHPERKERLEAIMTLLKREGVLDKLIHIKPRAATFEEVSRVHDPHYINLIEEACAAGRGYLDMDTYLNKHSYAVALMAVGGALEALDHVIKKNAQAFLLARPPGHHAEPTTGMGFCLFNNIALAAAAAKERYGLKRILIVDWDVHHGNGTQEAFVADPDVLFFSIHQSPAFPGTGNSSELGTGRGEGYTVNVPLKPGLRDGDYRIIFEELLLPLAHEFKPELVLVSAGQDSHVLDPLAGMELTTAAYRWMSARVQEIAAKHCQGKLLLTLEGGYDLHSLSESTFVIMDELTGWGSDVGREPLEPPRDGEGVAEKVARMRSRLSATGSLGQF